MQCSAVQCRGGKWRDFVCRCEINKDRIVRAGGRVVDGRGSIERRANDGARSRRSGGGEDDARAGRVRGRVSTAFDHGTFSRGRAVLWMT